MPKPESKTRQPQKPRDVNRLAFGQNGPTSITKETAIAELHGFYRDPEAALDASSIDQPLTTGEAWYWI